MANKPTNWSTIAKPKPVGDYQIGSYDSKYQGQIDSALDRVVNWNYDPLQDASYQSLARVYEQRGNVAAKNSMADAAALNGGYGTSYAASAAQQARNQYNQELAAMVPELERNAYSKATGSLAALREADNTDYSRYRDTESDRQFKYTQEYNKWRDMISDYQWHNTFNYQTARDKIADRRWNLDWQRQAQRDAVADRQWAQEYALKKDSAGGGGGGGGGGRRRSSGGRGSSGGGGSAPSAPSGNNADAGRKAAQAVRDVADTAKKTTSIITRNKKKK